MAVIPITDPSKITFYRNGSAGASEVVGYEANMTRVVRYEFTVPSPGASSIKAQVSGPYMGNGKEYPIRFYIGTSPTSHANAGAASVYTGTADINTSSRTVTLSADVILLPNTTYYLWFFPSVNAWGWYYWSLNCTVTTYGGSSSQPTVSASSVEMGKSLTIYTNRAAGFTHKLTYLFGQASGTIATGVTDSYLWTPAVSLAAQIPNSSSGTATVYCTTYDENGKQIGDPLSVSLTLTVPQSLSPVAGLTSITDSSGAKNLVGCFVQNVSRLVVEAYGTAKQGATIKSISMKLNGKSFSGGMVTAAGDLKLEITVADSRGLTGTLEDTVPVEAYTAPKVRISASRCTADGTADETGEYANVTITGTTTAFGGENTATMTFTHKTEDTANVSTGSFTYTDQISAPSTEVLTLTAVLHDKLSEAGLVQPGQSTMPLSVGYATMDMLKGGKGIAFGATATQEGFTCAMPARFTGGVSGIDAAGVGAAPGGFGLGTSVATAPTNDSGSADANLITKTGFYRALTNKPFTGWCYILHMQYGSGVAKQFCFDVDVNCSAMRNYYDSTWEAWEYINPPMTAGVEYRLIERYAGKPVYIMLIDCGTMPGANSTVDIAHGIANLQYITDFGGVMTVGGTKPIALPYYYTSTNYAHLSVDLSKIKFVTGGTGLGNYTDTKVWLKYTKATD